MRTYFATTLSTLALILAMAVATFAQQGGFHVDVQNKDEGGNNGFYDRVGVLVEVVAPEVVFVGTPFTVEFTITNFAGRAIPSVTAWEAPTFKKAGDYASGYTSGAIVYGYDSKGKAITEVSISDGASLTFTVGPFVPTVAGDFVIDDIEIWTRLGNKNFQDQLFGGLRGDKIVVEVIEQKIEFPNGIGTDKDGNLIIDSNLIGGVLPQTNGQVWMAIWIDGKGICASCGKTCQWGYTNKNCSKSYNTNSKTVKIDRVVLKEGVVAIEAEAYDPNDPNVVLAFYLIMENGKAVGAYFVCFDCEEAKCVCE